MEVNPIGLCLDPPLPKCIVDRQQLTIQWFEECGGRGQGTMGDDLRNWKGGGHGRAGNEMVRKHKCGAAHG